MNNKWCCFGRLWSCLRLGSESSSTVPCSCRRGRVLCQGPVCQCRLRCRCGLYHSLEVTCNILVKIRRSNLVSSRPCNGCELQSACISGLLCCPKPANSSQPKHWMYGSLHFMLQSSGTGQAVRPGVNSFSIPVATQTFTWNSYVPATACLWCAGSHVTRFIGLAELGNTSKQKSLHALSIQPAAEMEPSALQQKPAGTTPCPYIAVQKRPIDDNPRGQVQDILNVTSRIFVHRWLQGAVRVVWIFKDRLFQDKGAHITCTSYANKFASHMLWPGQRLGLEVSPPFSTTAKQNPFETSTGFSRRFLYSEWC